MSQTGPQFASVWRRHSRALLGSLWLFAAFLWTPWGVDWLIGSASLDSPLAHTVLLVVGIALAAWALFSFLRPPSRNTMRVHVLLASIFLVTPLVGEVLVRVGMGADLGGLRNAKLYADSYAEDDYWKLKRKWKAPSWVNPHPVLGWRPKSTEKNPLGILRAAGYVPQTENVVLCFGDSFMAGVTPIPHKIPDQLEQRLKGMAVYNCGVGGYGVGQIYLRFLEEYPAYVKPVIVVGILTSDLDRTILSVRGAPKPRFRIVDQELVLDAPVLPPDPKDWDAHNPPEIRSYLFAMGAHALRLRAGGGKPDTLTYRRDEKRRVNRAIIEALVEEAREQDLRLLFITFPSSRKLGQPTWRDDFLQEVFDDLGVPWVNGRQAIKKDIRKHARKPDAYFLEDNHPNELGNEVFAAAIATRLKKLWGLKTR